MSQIYFLDLPILPANIYDSMIDACGQIPIQEQSRQWVHDFQRGELTVAGHEYGTTNTNIPQEIQQQIRDIYQPFFPDESIWFILGRLSNVVGAPSSSPPHCDRARRVAINYVLQTGGNDVRTRFYHQRRCETDLSAAENRYWGDLTVAGETVLPVQSWHAYDVQQFHSVENIETDRFLFSIVLLESNPSIVQFNEKYQTLISHTLDV